jgi:hypothetical protein
MALTRDKIAQRNSQEIQEGFYVNLGIGIPRHWYAIGSDEPRSFYALHTLRKILCLALH